jgi:hypothetical protein
MDFITKAIQTHGNKYDYSKVIYKNSRTKVTIICPIHGEFDQIPAMHLYGNGCKECGYSSAIIKSRITFDEFLNRSKKIHGNKYDYSKSNYIDTKKKIIIICSIHGEFIQSPINHMDGQGCIKCGFDRSTKLKMLPLNEFIKRSNELYGSKYDYSKVNYVNNHTKVMIICPIHGEFEQTPKSHLKGHECSKCGYVKLANKFSHDKETFVNRAIEIHNNKYDYSKVDYKNCDTKVKIVCPEHGEFQQAPVRHLIGENCPKCKYEKLSKKFSNGKDEFVLRSIKVHGDKYNYSKTVYSSLKNDVLIICPIHGEFYQNPGVHIRGSGCPKCGLSSIHNKCYEFIKSLGLNCVSNDRKLINPYELDLIVDGRLAIELHGLYWHSYQQIETSEEREKHSYKLNMCINKNIKLLQFFENEIIYKFNIVSSMIKGNLGLNNRIFARNCNIVDVNNPEYEKFCSENHLQGKVSTCYKYGLLYNDKLVSVIGLNKHNEYDYELMRYCNILNNNIIGGFSKLLSHFIKNHDPKSIMTYADRRYSMANVYLKNGFKLLKITKPNYFYVKGDKIFSRQKFQKHKLHKLINHYDESLTEIQNMFNNKYRRIWDAGHWKLLYQK